MISLTDSSIDGERAIEIQETEQKEDIPVNFTLWGETKSQTVENTELYRSARLNVLTVYGDAGLVLPSDGILNRDDYEGCLISEDMAYELFQSTNVIDQIIEYGGRSYIIRGTIPNVEEVLMIQATALTSEVMNRISVEITSGQRARVVVEGLANRYGFPNESRSVQVYSEWSGMIIGVILLVMGAGILIPLIKICINCRKQPALCLVNCGITFLLLLIFMWIVKSYYHYPDDMIPNRWSDFEFWTDLFEQKWTEFLALLQAEKTVVEMMSMKPFLQVLKYSVCVIALYGLFVRKSEIDNVVSLYIYLAAAVISSYIGVLLCRDSLNEVTKNRVIWYFMIFYLCGKYVVGKLHKAEAERNAVLIN